MEGFFVALNKIFLKSHSDRKEKIMKKTLALILTIAILALSCIGLASCTNPDASTTTDPNTGKPEPKYTVGICQLVQHPALDQATQGFIDTLKAEFGDDIAFDVQNASNDTNLCTTIVNSFVNKKVDLIMANATPALQAAYNATETIPILGTSVTEYGVALEIDNFGGTVGGNVSGTSDLAPLKKQAEMILEVCPDTKSVAIIYCTGEANSKYQVEKMTKYLTEMNVEVKPFGFSDSNDISAIVMTAASQCDVLYIPTDNTAASCSETIGNIAREKKIAIFTGEENIAKACGVASLSISYYDLGVQTAQMAIKILKGEANISDMAIEYAPATRKFNKEFCDLLGITPPEGYVEMK